MKPPVAAVPADPTTVAARLAGHDRRPVLGVAFVLLAVSCFVVLDTTVKPLAPCMSVQIAVAMLAGWIVFGQVPAGIDFLGMWLIMACGMGAAWLSARRVA